MSKASLISAIILLVSFVVLVDGALSFLAFIATLLIGGALALKLQGKVPTQPTTPSSW